MLSLVGGCYFSTERVIASGEDIGLEAGTYVCKGKTTETIELRKRSETTPSGPDTIYTVERTDYRFAVIGGGLYLVQGTESSSYSYAFVDYSDHNRLRVLTRNPGEAEALRRLAEKHQLGTKPYLAGDDSMAQLTGKAADVRAFLTAQERSMLTELMTCSR